MSDLPSPEAYFQSLDLDIPFSPNLTPEEMELLRLYAGVLLEPSSAAETAPPAPQPIPSACLLASPQQTASHPAPATQPNTPSAPEPKAPPTPQLSPAPTAAPHASTIRLVGFRVADNDYFLPVSDVQEVLPYASPTRLPAAPRAVAGILQLRGRVTPIICLEELLGTSARAKDRERFIVLCRAEGMQLGLVAHGLAPMQQVAALDIEWNVEARLGETGDLVAGIFPRDGKLSSILSVAAIRRAILQS